MDPSGVELSDSEGGKGVEGDLCPQLPGFSSHCVDAESLGGLDHTEATIT